MALSPLLVDAKKEYTHQLADLLAPYVMNTLARIYEKASKKEKLFRELLRQVPNWNATMIDERTNEIERRNPQLGDLIAACCVSYTKVLGSIKLNQSQQSNVRISLPHSNTFVHGVYTHVAKEYFYEPKMLYADRHAKMNLMHDAVEESIRQHVPIQQLLKAYLSIAVDDQGMDPIAASVEKMASPPGSPQAMQHVQQAMSPMLQVSVPGTPMGPPQATMNDLELMQQLQQLQQLQNMQEAMQQPQMQQPQMTQPVVMQQPQPVVMQQPQPMIMQQQQPVQVMPITVPQQEPQHLMQPQEQQQFVHVPQEQQQAPQQAPQPEFFDDVADFH